MRHGPRAVHRRAAGRVRVRARATSRWASSKRSGARAAERWGVAVGDRVAVEVFQSCRACGPCLAGAYRRCERHGMRDMYGFVPVATAPGLWGGYAEYQYLGPDSMLLPVPPELEPDRGDAVQPARRRHPVGRHRPGDAARRRRRRARPGRAGAVGMRSRQGGGRRVRDGDRRRSGRRRTAGAGAALRRRPRGGRRQCRPGQSPPRRDRRRRRRRRRRHREGTRGPRAGDRDRPCRRHHRHGRHPRLGRDPRLLARPHRLQGAAHPRRARRRRPRLPSRARPPGRRPLPVRRPAPPVRGPRRCRGASSARWPARATGRRPCTASSPPDPPAHDEERHRADEARPGAGRGHPRIPLCVVGDPGR